MIRRFAVVFTTDPDVVAEYLPRNYVAIATAPSHLVDARFSPSLTASRAVLLTGYDSAGWTLDGYVLPRLASGMHFGEEVDQRAAEAFCQVVAGF